MAQQPAVSRAYTQSIIEENKVLKNTYLLLAMTLVFSAFAAWLSMTIQMPPMSPLLTMVGYILLLMFTQMNAQNALGLVGTFLFTGFLGFTLGPILNLYIAVLSNGPEIIMASFGATGLVFFTLSGYVLTTRASFSYLGGFLMSALTLVILFSLVSLFIPMPAMQLMISFAIALINAGYILYETSQIIHGGQRNYIMATIQLYVSLYNMFLSLLHILASASGNRRN